MDIIAPSQYCNLEMHILRLDPNSFMRNILIVLTNKRVPHSARENSGNTNIVHFQTATEAYALIACLHLNTQVQEQATST